MSTDWKSSISNIYHGKLSSSTAKYTAFSLPFPFDVELETKVSSASTSISSCAIVVDALKKNVTSCDVSCLCAYSASSSQPPEWLLKRLFRCCPVLEWLLGRHWYILIKLIRLYEKSAQFYYNYLRLFNVFAGTRLASAETCAEYC